MQRTEHAHDVDILPARLGRRGDVANRRAVGAQITSSDPKVAVPSASYLRARSQSQQRLIFSTSVAVGELGTLDDVRRLVVNDRDDSGAATRHAAARMRHAVHIERVRATGLAQPSPVHF